MSYRVLYVVDNLGTGGAQRSLAEMLAGLADRQWETTIVCLQHRAEGIENEVMSNGAEVRFLRGRRLATRLAEMRSLIRSIAPDLVHTTLFEASLVGRLAAIGQAPPVLTSLVNTPYEPVRRNDPRIRNSALTAVKVVDGWTSRHLTTHFHAITNAVKDAAVHRLGLPPERVTVVERGRDPARLGTASRQRRQQARSELGVSPDAEIVVTVGRQEFQKGHDVLLKAVRGLLDRRPKLVVLIAGRSGQASPELEEASRSLPPERVRFLGHHPDVPAVLAAADVFAFPSRFEGLGCAVIEAMALSLPIVASDIPALREVLEPSANALLVPVGDPGPLAGAIERLLADAALAASFGQRSRAIFDERFTLDRSTGRMAALYDRVRSSHRNGRG